MAFVNWVIQVNELLEKNGYDCLFNEEEIEEAKQGNLTIRTFLQQDAEFAWHKGLSSQSFIEEFVL